MDKAPVTRRGFLRLCMIAAGSVVASSCQKTLQNLTPEVVPTATASPMPSIKLEFPGGNVDAWTWVKQVRVNVSRGECEKVMLRANGQEFEAQRQDDRFAANVKLVPGENQIDAVCLQAAGAEAQSEPVIYTERLRQAPTARIEIRLDGRRIQLDGDRSMPAEGGPNLVEYIWSARPDNPAPLQLEDGTLLNDVSGPSFRVVPPVVDGEYYLSLRVSDQSSQEDTSTTYFVIANGEPLIPDYDHENPAWVENAVVYGVVPFLFGRPAFKALVDQLDDLADLGINALWLAPINVHPAGDYGYAVENYFGLDPACGTEEDFHGLIQAAHERGIRILMDFVPNHTSDTHPYFQDAKKRGTNSNYWDFYDRDEDGNPTHYFTWTNLPNLNYDHPEVRQMMIDAFSHWVREFDVDGFRVDAAWAIQERRPEFWPEWRRALKRIKPDLLLLAEAGAREPYYFDNGFDAAYDWTYQVGGWAWKVVWDAYKLRLLSYNLSNALTNGREGFSPDALIFRFLNNNDTGKRFITRHGEGITRVATALLLTLPGIPCVYTGDEYGLEFEPYERVEALVFEEKYRGLRDYHKRLIALRRSLPSLHSRLFSLIKPDAVPQTVFGYIRFGEPSAAPVIVLLNFSEEQTEFLFDIPQEFGTPSADGSLYDLLADETILAFAGGRARVSVPAMTARVLAAEKLA